MDTIADDAFSSGPRREIVESVFPELRHGDDPALERYLELRKEGKIVAALALYNGSLLARYPRRLLPHPPDQPSARSTDSCVAWAA